MKPFAIVLTLCFFAETTLATEPPSSPDSAEEYSPDLAVTLSWLPAALMVGTGIGLLCGAGGENNSDDMAGFGLGLLVAGLTVGPSIGHMYTGDWLRAGMFSLGRIVGAGAIAYGASVYVGNAAYSFDHNPDRHDGEDLASVAFWGGLAATVGLTIWEAIDAGECARQKNTGHSLTLSPLVLPPAPSANQSSAIGVGMGLSGAF